MRKHFGILTLRVLTLVTLPTLAVLDSPRPLVRLPVCALFALKAAEEPKEIAHEKAG